MEMTIKYLFVCGCPRSGTTALVKLLNSHPSIAIGMERYKYWSNPQEIHKIQKQSFQPEHFFDIKDEQTNINWDYFYDKLKEKFSQENLITGDKNPHYYRHYQELENQFDNVKWIFLIRDINDVALSYNKRAADPNDAWPEDANYTTAVAHWNNSLIKTWHYFSDRDTKNLFVCEYEKFFTYNESYFQSLVNFLEVESSPEMHNYYKVSTQNWEKNLANKKENLDEVQLNYIKTNCRFKLKNALIKKYGAADLKYDLSKTY
jgi:hypothetical protein